MRTPPARSPPGRWRSHGAARSSRARTPNGLKHLLRRAFAACGEQARRCAARNTESIPALLAPRVPASARNGASRYGVQTVRRSSTWPSLLQLVPGGVNAAGDQRLFDAHDVVGAAV